jgi:hypothetical protein
LSFLYPCPDEKRIAVIVPSVNEGARFGLTGRGREAKKAERLFFGELDNSLLELRVRLVQYEQSKRGE